MRLAYLFLLVPSTSLLGAHAVSPHERTSAHERTSLTKRSPRYDRVHTLSPKEGVFAYARISPDGNRLAYSSQIHGRPTNQRTWAITVVDLASKKVLMNENGIDAYFSNDGKRLIYAGSGGVNIRNLETGAMGTYPQASQLGDYFSWSVRDGRDLILTIANNYYFLDNDRPVLPHHQVPKCDRIGTGDRPLISKDGKRITTFFKGNLVVRGLDNCENIFETGIQGSKADFSFDGRYIAFHVVKRAGTGYEIQIVDLERRTVRTLEGLPGSALFPSWTQDGRLCFRYDGPDYRGFIIASNVLDADASQLPAVSEALPDNRRWEDIFPETPKAARGLSMVMIWAPWSAHSLEAFTELQAARDALAGQGVSVDVMNAADPGSRETDIAAQLQDFDVTVPRIPLSQKGLARTEARNQMPTTLLFQDGVLVDSRLGAQSAVELRKWISSVSASPRDR